jgi:hypothetical protein
VQARGIFAFGAVVILAVSAPVILFLHPKHATSLGASPLSLGASASAVAASTPTSQPGATSTSSPSGDPCAGKQPWISGPADDRLRAHLGPADVRIAARAPDELAAAWSTGAVTNRGLSVLFSDRATVGQANAALCEANVDVAGVLPIQQRVLMVYVPGKSGPEDVHVARGKLIAHRFVVAVAPANMTRIQEGLAFKTDSARFAHNRCDWASGELAKKLGIAKPLYCYQSERREIRDREVLFAAVRADKECAVAAIVDDDGVFPLTTRCQPSSAFAKLAATELTGEKHWSLATDDAKKALSTLLHQVENAWYPGQ